MTLRVFARMVGAVLVTMFIWIGIRLVFPQFDYYPPDTLFTVFDRSMIHEAGLRRPAMVAYVALELTMMIALFLAVQTHWPGRRDLKGMVFGASAGIIWAFGFLTGWAFLGTTLEAELLNGALDIPPLMLCGWMAGRIAGTDTPRCNITPAWAAIAFVGGSYILVHAVATTVLATVIGPVSIMLLVPQTPAQFLVLGGLGLFAGTFYALLRPGLVPLGPVAGAALFAFGVFGQSWAWFQLFFVIEFDAIAAPALILALVDATGIFIGILAYEASHRLQPQTANT